MNPLTQKTKAIAAVCPIDGISEDGKIWFKDEATQEQRAAAEELFESFVETPDPNWAQFRIAMILDTAFLRVTDSKNCHQVLCAAIASEINRDAPSPEGLQMVHNSILSQCPPDASPTEEEIAAWQSYADSAHCPVNFDPFTGLI